MSKTSSSRRSAQPGVQALDWLGRNPRGSDLLHAAHDLLALESALAGTLPAALARRVCAAQLDGALLTVMVPGAAHAARLRQMLPAAVQRLRDAGWPVERIVVRIDARGPLPGTEKPLREIQPLGPQALRSFERLGREVAPGPLADAIQRLLSRHGR
jgi:hypothetical protein